MAKRALRVAVFGDTHFPWHNPEKIDAAVARAEAFRADVCIQAGDLYDLYAWSKYAKSLNLMTPAREIERGRLGAEGLWFKLHRRLPRAKCFQLRGNHDIRIEVKVAEKCPEVASLLSIAGLWDFDGVETVMDPREELVVDGVWYQHGHLKEGAHAPYNQRSTVVGHLHKGYVHYFKQRERVFFELNAACLANLKSPVMKYTAQKTHKMMNGMGLVEGATSAQFVVL